MYTYGVYMNLIRFVRMTILLISIFNLGVFPLANASSTLENQSQVLSTLIQRSLSRISKEDNKKLLTDYLKQTQLFSGKEITDALSLIGKIKFQTKEGCILCTKMNIQNKEYTFNLYEITQNFIKGSINGKTFHFNKQYPFSPKKLASISKGELHSFMNLFLSEAYADALMFMLIIGASILISAAIAVETLFENGLEWIMKKRIGGDFCCDLVKNAKQKGYELQDHSSACILDMHKAIHSGDTLNRGELESLRTYREMENIFSEFNKLDELSESEREYILSDVNRFIETCSDIEPKFKFSNGYTVEGIENDENCVKQFDQSKQLVSDAAENGRVLSQCLDLAKSVRGEKKYGVKSRESEEAPIRKINESDRNKLNEIKKKNSAIKTFFRSVDK